MTTSLYTASFYKPDHWVGDRYRVSRAHPRGKRVDWETQPYLYPSRPLLREYREGGVDFQALTVLYRQELEAAYDAEIGFREWLAGLAGGGDFTLLCFERADQPCHRRLAAAWLLERTPGLQLGQLR